MKINLVLMQDDKAGSMRDCLFGDEAEEWI